MNIRNDIFWLSDTVKGGKVRNELKKTESDMLASGPSEDKLKAILKYAVDNVPYYKNIKSSDIKSFPVMNKSKYLADYNMFQSPEFAGKDLYTYYTSGSSGTPFHGFQDSGKRNKHTADFLYFMKKCGWDLGEKYIFLRAWTSNYKNSKLHNIKNNSITFDVLNFNEEMMKQVSEHLVNDKSIKMLLGYGSVLNQFADYVEKNNIYTDNLKTIVSDSDALGKDKRLILKKHFNCNVIDRYSNEEHGLIGFSFDIDEPFEINYSSYFVELLKLDSDEYAEKGEVGRVVITDLYNKAMPLIRYELGDLAISDDESRCGVVSIRNLQGRLSDMIVQKSGVRISSTVVNNHMDYMEGVEKYQLIQNGIGDFILYVVEKTPKYTDEDFCKTLEPCIESGSVLKVVRTDDILSGKNGKYKTLVSKCE